MAHASAGVEMSDRHREGRHTRADDPTGGRGRGAGNIPAGLRVL